MMIPTVHMNGTSKKELFRQLFEAASAVTKAIDALNHATPHGRDYYLQGDDAIDRALAEHKARRAKLESVHEDIVQIATAL